MKERGIIMNDEMARAVWERQKTQTRRPVKLPIDAGWEFTQKMGCIKNAHPLKGKYGAFFERQNGHLGTEITLLPSPYGQPGDRLWIREAWAAWDSVDSPESEEVEYAIELMPESGIGRHHCGYRANLNEHADRWRPSIHMPRWAARSVREIVAVRVERVQDISEADAMAEGLVESDLGRLASHLLRCYKGEDRPPLVLQFADLWQSIYGGTEFAWENNPWVWVYEFKKVEASK